MTLALTRHAGSVPESMTFAVNIKYNPDIREGTCSYYTEHNLHSWTLYTQVQYRAETAFYLKEIDPHGDRHADISAIFQEVNKKRLTELHLFGSLPRKTVEMILSSSPNLKTLKLSHIDLDSLIDFDEEQNGRKLHTTSYCDELFFTFGLPVSVNIEIEEQRTTRNHSFSIANILKKLPKLTAIELNHCDWVNLTALKILAENVPTLKRIDIKNCISLDVRDILTPKGWFPPYRDKVLRNVISMRLAEIPNVDRFFEDLVRRNLYGRFIEDGLKDFALRNLSMLKSLTVSYGNEMHQRRLQLLEKSKATPLVKKKPKVKQEPKVKLEPQVKEEQKAPIKRELEEKKAEGPL